MRTSIFIVSVSAFFAGALFGMALIALDIERAIGAAVLGLVIIAAGLTLGAK